MNVKHDNVKAGVFVVAGVVLALIVIFSLTNFEKMFEGRQTVKIYYTLTEGLQGLKEGASVTLGDQPIGDVTAIEDVHQPNDEGQDRIIGKLIVVMIPKRYEINWNAQIELAVPTIGSGTKLNISSVGRDLLYDPDQPLPESLAKLLRPNLAKALPVGAIPGQPPTSTLTKGLGIEDEQRVQIKDIIAKVHSIVTSVNDKLPGVMDKAGTALAEAKTTMATARKFIEDNEPKLSESIENVRLVTAEARDRSKVWFDRIDGITENADTTLARINKLLEEKEAGIRESVDNVREATGEAKALVKDIREKTLTQVTEALNKADKAVANVLDASQELKTFAAGQRPVLERTVANFQITSGQLKLAAIEVRRSPWRLLYQPGDDELAYDNLYDSARSFALAAEALNSAVAALRAVKENDSANAEQVQQMLDHLEKLFAKYKETEAKFFDALGGKKPTKTTGE